MPTKKHEVVGTNLISRAWHASCIFCVSRWSAGSCELRLEKLTLRFMKIRKTYARATRGAEDYSFGSLY